MLVARILRGNDGERNPLQAASWCGSRNVLGFGLSYTDLAALSGAANEQAPAHMTHRFALPEG